MKPMRTDLTPTRVARCKAVIEGFGEERAERAFRDMCAPRYRFEILNLLTEEAIEALAFRLVGERVSQNRMNARNRAIRAERAETAS